jgi:hypothetical protein
VGEHPLNGRVDARFQARLLRRKVDESDHETA